MGLRTGNEQSRLLNDIGMVSFAIVELTQYLDTHPYDKDALEYFNHYNRIKDQMTREYSAKYGPLTISTVDSCQKEWKWALQPMPWEGVC